MEREEARKQLIELQKEALDKCNYTKCKLCPFKEYGLSTCQERLVADYLIANGVTVRDKAKWKLRIDDCDCEYVMCSACGAVFYNYDEDTIDYTPDFCVGCGADMRGEEHEID